MWEDELTISNDPNKDSILHDIRHGFPLVDEHIHISHVTPVYVNNSTSVLKPDMRGKVQEQILEEIQYGNYSVCDSPNSKPIVISALSVVPKPDGGIRLIHDFSRPEGVSVNSYASKEPCGMQTVDDAIKLVRPGYYMAKVDLK